MIPTSVPTTSFALGGAIDVNSEATGPATISNSTFTGNQVLGGSPGASAGGGAVSNSSNFGATMTVTDCTLSGNAAIGAAGGDGENNYGSGQGGGINDFSSLSVSNSTLTDNLALGTPMAPGAVPSQTVSSGRATAGGGVFSVPRHLRRDLRHRDHNRQYPCRESGCRRCRAAGMPVWPACRQCRGRGRYLPHRGRVSALADGLGSLQTSLWAGPAAAAAGPAAGWRPRRERWDRPRIWHARDRQQHDPH